MISPSCPSPSLCAQAEIQKEFIGNMIAHNWIEVIKSAQRQGIISNYQAWEDLEKNLKLETSLEKLIQKVHSKFGIPGDMMSVLSTFFQSSKTKSS